MQPKLTVKMVPTDELVPYAGNAKEHPDWQIEQIAASIEQFGFDDPVGIWHNPQGQPVIVEGHGRVLAAKELGIEQVPTIALDHLDDEGRRAYTLAHNKINQATPLDENIVLSQVAIMPDMELGKYGIESIKDVMKESDIKAPEILSLTITMTPEQYVVVNDAIKVLPDDQCRSTGGGRTANAIHEMLSRMVDCA